MTDTTIALSEVAEKGADADFIRQTLQHALQRLMGLAVLDDAHRRDLLEVLDDRHGNGSTIVTGQLPIDHWHAAIGDATLADAILDRLVHNAHQLNLKGDSMRKKRANLTSSPRPE